MSIIATRMQNLRAMSPNLDKWETRPSNYGAFDSFVQGNTHPSPVVSSELKAKAMASIGSVLESPVLDFNGNVTITNTRTATISDAENTSAMVQFTFSTLSFGFTQLTTLFHNNEIKAQEDFNNKFMSGLYQLALELDTMAATKLGAVKSQVIGDNLGYTETADVIVADFADREKIVADVVPLMFTNDFFGPFDLVGNARFASLMRQMDEKGLYNYENKRINYMDHGLGFSNRITAGANQGAFFYAIQQGSLGVIFRVEREALYAVNSRTGHEWGVETLPMLNIPIGTYYYEGVGDYNAMAGAASADMTRAHKKFFGFSVDVCLVAAYNEDPTTKASPVLACAVATT